MIECVFTIDYEIYGNGEGSLRELVYQPTERLMATFGRYNTPFVAFVEAIELQRIEEYQADDAIDDVRRQIRGMHKQGVEIGLHLHPQWYNALYKNRRWLLDYREYNLCTLPQHRIEQIVRSSIVYLRNILGEPGFTPFSFRSGGWLFQPTQSAAAILAENGIKLDSSVFKGGFKHNYGLDYRPALRNGYYWHFQNDINKPDPEGTLIEVPTYTVMVPFWKMFNTKRMSLQRKIPVSLRNNRQKLNHLLDYLRFRYPLKFDFCRMKSEELISMLDKVIEEEMKYPNTYRPLVAIGHTKDLSDFDTVNSFLSYIEKRDIRVVTFKEVYSRCKINV